MKKLIFILITALLLTGVDGFSKPKVDPEFVKFFKEFQSAIKANDKEKVADMTEFPISNTGDENAKLSRTQFLKYFDFIFEGTNFKSKNAIKYINLDNENKYSYVAPDMSGTPYCFIYFGKNEAGYYRMTELELKYYPIWPDNFEDALKDK